MNGTFDLAAEFAHLGGGHVVPQPAFDGYDWYQGYGARHGSDGAAGMLVSQFTFTESWDSWEMHPAGDELVLCLDGAITLVREHADGTSDTVMLTAGRYAINPEACWHTTDVAGSASCLFITAGLGTDGRPR